MSSARPLLTSFSSTAALALAAGVVAMLMFTGCAEARRKVTKVPAPSPGCKEPSPSDAGLATGLSAYARGDWAGATTALQAWSGRPDADKDPAAARGFYALGFAWRMQGVNAPAETAFNRAEPLLKARLAAAPSLEAAYYLQALYQVRGEQQAQLQVIADALRGIDAGTTCAQPDPDDMFRLARLRGIAGDKEKQRALLEQASRAYAAQVAPSGPTDGRSAVAGAAPAAIASPYRALTERELGAAALEAGDAPAAAEHLAIAARLDPTIPGVHRDLGMALIRSGKLQQAVDEWRGNWKVEREGGNALVYSIPVVMDVIKYRAQLPDQIIADMSVYTIPALEDNAKVEAGRWMELAAKSQGGAALSPEDTAAMTAADFKLKQMLLEYILRGQDLPEFALRNGLLPAIHHRGLPERPPELAQPAAAPAAGPKAKGRQGAKSRR